MDQLHHHPVVGVNISPSVIVRGDEAIEGNGGRAVTEVR